MCDNFPDHPAHSTLSDARGLFLGFQSVSRQLFRVCWLCLARLLPRGGALLPEPLLWSWLCFGPQRQNHTALQRLERDRSAPQSLPAPCRLDPGHASPSSHQPVSPWPSSTRGGGGGGLKNAIWEGGEERAGSSGRITAVLTQEIWGRGQPREGGMRWIIAALVLSRERD